jgi:hypothetical protein
MSRYDNPGAVNGTLRAHGARNGDRPDDGPPVRQPEDTAGRIAIAAAKRGEWDAIHYLYGRYADDVFSYVLSIVRDRHEAENLTQNIFLELRSEITKYEERSMPFTAWITGVARTASLRPAPEERH